jgi:hypothetical protein
MLQECKKREKRENSMKMIAFEKRAAEMTHIESRSAAKQTLIIRWPTIEIIERHAPLHLKYWIQFHL